MAEDGVLDFINVSAALFQSGGHSGEATLYYVERAMADVADRLNAPSSLDATARRVWLDDIAANRGIRGNLRCRRFNEAAHRMVDSYYDRGPLRLQLARDVHTWKQEMLHAD